MDFHIEDHVAVKVVVFDRGGCRPASLVEIAQDAEIERLKARVKELDRANNELRQEWADLREVDALNTARIRALEATVERRGDTLHQLRQWCEAYPLDIFPEPDMKQARRGLEYVGITLGAVSASNMRHVLKGVGEILDQALAGDGEKTTTGTAKECEPEDY